MCARARWNETPRVGSDASLPPVRHMSESSPDGAARALQKCRRMDATESIWESTVQRNPHRRLERNDLHVDIAVIGGGITGTTAAILSKLAGKRVALLEARVIGSGVTGGTTAHLTEAVDTRYVTLESKFG